MSLLLARFFLLLLILPVPFGVLAESLQHLHTRNGSLSSTLQVETPIPEVLETDPWYKAVGGDGDGKICFESAEEWKHYIYVGKGLPAPGAAVTYTATEKQFDNLRTARPLFLEKGMFNEFAISIQSSYTDHER